MVLYCRNVPRANGMPGDRYGAMVLIGRIVASGYGSRLSGVCHPRSRQIALVPVIDEIASGCRRERKFLASWLRERLAPDRP